MQGRAMTELRMKIGFANLQNRAERRSETRRAAHARPRAALLWENVSHTPLSTTFAYVDAYFYNVLQALSAQSLCVQKK